MSKVTMPEPFWYFFDWGDYDGLQRIAMYWGEPGNGIDNDWNEHPKLHKNVPVFTSFQLEAYAAAKVREALEEAATVCDTYFKEIEEQTRSTYQEGLMDAADILEQRIRSLIK